MVLPHVRIRRSITTAYKLCNISCEIEGESHELQKVGIAFRSY